MLEENITLVNTYGELKDVLEKRGGFIKASWCGKTKCEERIKDETGATIRIVPFEKEKPVSNCIICGAEAQEIVYFARSY
jgi:prolyl-tRNA synthetase